MSWWCLAGPGSTTCMKKVSGWYGGELQSFARWFHPTRKPPQVEISTNCTGAQSDLDFPSGNTALGLYGLSDSGSCEGIWGQ